MSLRFIGNMVFTSMVINNKRVVFSGHSIDDLFEKISKELN
ncbi:MAG: hypothetical protein ACRCW9_01815 [Cetobacterium sp.]